jgi:hypothetical protein
MSDPTLFELEAFEPENQWIKKYVEYTQSQSGTYNLGGFIKMLPTDKITDELLKIAGQKLYDSDDSYNSVERNSLCFAKGLLCEVEAAVKRYRER